MPPRVAFQFRVAKHKSGGTTLDTERAIPRGQTVQAVGGTTDAVGYVEPVDSEGCSVLERGFGGKMLMAEVGWIASHHAALAGGTQNCMVNHET